MTEKILMFSGIILACVVFYFLFSSKTEDQDRVFSGSLDDDFDLPDGEPAKRAHVAHQEKVEGFWAFLLKSGPKMIIKVLISFSIVSVASGYVSIKNAERIAAIGSALAQGNIVTAITSSFSFGREPAIEFKNIAFGTNIYLSENGLEEFAYIGDEKGIATAIMRTVYSTQHHDPELTSDDEIYNTPMKGMSVSEAKELCVDRYESYNGNLVSFEEWEIGQSNFIGKDNFTKLEDPEWTRTFNENDDDDYRIIPKMFNYTKYVEDEGIDNEEDGLYIDGDDSDRFLFRCSINWTIQE